ncbi:MAG: OmpA family protein [bacterium]
MKTKSIRIIESLFISIIFFMIFIHPAISQFLGYTQTNLGININSQEDELAPLISPDGKTLYFTRSYSETIDGKEEYFQYIWYSEKSNGSWCDAKKMEKPFNESTINGICSISPDGNTALIVGKYIDGTYTLGFSVCEKEGDEWQTPKALEIPNYENISKGDFAEAYLANNNTILFLSISENNENTSQSNYDLYVCFLNDTTEEWSEPINIGKTVNSKFAEHAPFLAPDNRTLFFSSNKVGGFGSYDLYKSVRLDDTWMNWSEVENLGGDINSLSFDAYISLDARGDSAYIISDKNSLGKSDIKIIPLKHKITPTIILSGQVFDNCNLAVKAKIKFEYLGDKGIVGRATSNSKNGNFKVVLPYGKKYIVYAEADSCFGTAKKLDLSSIGKYGETSENLILTCLKKCHQQDLQDGNIPVQKPPNLSADTNLYPREPILNVLFDKNSDKLEINKYQNDLNRLLNFLMKYNQTDIILQGHTCDLGDRSYNLKLSEKRAESVKSYLVINGIKKSRIKTFGFGSDKLLYNNCNNEECRSKNRRIEYQILWKK